MPELPEVETVRRGLEPVLLGARVTEVQVRRAGLRRPFPVHLAERLTGRRVTGLRRRAKYLLIDLDGGDALLLHLGMSGRLLLTPARPNSLSPHDHLIFYTEAGVGVRFNDARRFGSLDWIEPGAEAEHPQLCGLGPEPLSDAFSVQTFSLVLRRCSAAIKPLLLDQRRVAGIGNIYACEALYSARIDPFRRAESLTRAEVLRLVPALKTVLAAAIDAGGASLRDHRQPKGDLGYFQRQFQVYGRAGASCFRCGEREGGAIQRAVQSGRSSFFCPTCQT